MFRGEGFQVNRTEYASEDPVVGISFGIVDRSVGRHFADGGFQQVFPAENQLVGDIILKPVKGALVDLPGRLSVDLHFGVGHGTFKDEGHFLPFP